MNPLSVILPVIGMIITVGIAMFPYFRKVYFVGPELTIELTPDGGTSGIHGLSLKNDKSQGYIDSDKAVYVFEVVWRMNLKITNNSNLIAYYPELSFFDKQLGFTTLEKLDKNTPIKENEQVILKGTYKMYEECEAKDRTNIVGIPEHLKDLKILLEYKNPSKKPFFTIYTYSNINNQNRYSRRKPKELKNNNRI